MTTPLRISKDCIYRYWSIAKCSLHRSRHLLRSEGLGWYHGWDGSGSLANEIFPFCTCFTLKCSDVDFHGWCVWWQCFLISGSGTVEALLGFECTLFLLKAVQYWEVALCHQDIGDMMGPDAANAWSPVGAACEVRSLFLILNTCECCQLELKLLTRMTPTIFEKLSPSWALLSSCRS